MSDTQTPVIVPDVDELTRVEEREQLRRTDDGDHDRFAHYVWGRNPRAKVTESMVTGVPIKALCGKKWVPSRDGSKYPVCPDCKRIKDRMQGRGGGDGDGE
ncbi:DUF3039 domain-containing protein [Euzebya sp.]|uniref:DUF3039 domain-containing protein n=1 Tax=Euzebya sp. TaxID=1971409 RepID=UPI00351958C7